MLAKEKFWASLSLKIASFAFAPSSKSSFGQTSCSSCCVCTFLHSIIFQVSRRRRRLQVLCLLTTWERQRDLHCKKVRKSSPALLREDADGWNLRRKGASPRLISIFSTLEEGVICFAVLARRRSPGLHFHRPALLLLLLYAFRHSRSEIALNWV